MKFNSIHHVVIICSDYEKSKKFYTKTLGLEIVQEVHRKERDSYKLDLKVGDKYQIELFSFPNPPKRPSMPEATGLRHLAFEVDDVDSAHKELTEKGLEIEAIRTDSTNSNKKFFFLSDPDNLPLEIYQK